MGIYEGITPEENREFTSSLGNWSGGIAWDPGPIGGRTGLIKIDVPIGPAENVGELSYPYAIPRKNRDNNFGLYFFRPLGQPPPEIKVTLSDGVYTFDRPWETIVADDTWIRVAYTVLIPSDWDIPGTIVSFTVKNNAPADPMTTYADGAALSVFTRVDHLPVMGIG